MSGAGEWSRFDSGRCYYDPGAGLRLTGSPPAALDTATAILSLHPRTAIPGTAIPGTATPHCYTGLLYCTAIPGTIPGCLLAQSTPVILTSMY